LSTIASSPKLVSGIMENRTSTGFIARAIVQSAQKKTHTIVMGDVVTSSVRKPKAANNLNVVNITYNVDLPANLTIEKASWFIQSAWTDNSFKAWIDGDYIPGSAASGSKLLEDLEGYFNAGRNYCTAIFTFGSGGYEGGDDGASHIVVNYTTNQMNTLAMNSTKKYFYDVLSNCSIKYKKPVYVAGTLDSVDINLHVIAENVTLGYVVDGIFHNISTKQVVSNAVNWTNAEIQTAMEGDGFPFSNISEKYIWYVFELDTYHWREEFGAHRRMYSDSYIDVQTDFNPQYEYSFIDITATLNPYAYSINDFGDFYRNVEWRFWVPNGSIPLMIDSQLAWLYWSGMDPDQKIWLNNNSLYSHPTQPLVEELARFGFGGNKTIQNETNSYKLNFTQGYSINPFNSLVSYTFLIKGAVPYGNAFDTEAEALDDAMQRLDLYLGDYLQETQITNETYSVGGVPFLWGPAIVEVRVWQ
jgi:hypothetical protein